MTKQLRVGVGSHWYALDIKRTDNRVGYEFYRGGNGVASGTVCYVDRTLDDAIDDAIDLFYQLYGLPGDDRDHHLDDRCALPLLHKP